MKNLHKKISIGVLVSGLLIGGVSLSSGSVSYAINNNEASLLLSKIESLSVSELESLLESLLQEGVRSLLKSDSDHLLKSVLREVSNVKEKEIINSIFGLGSKGNYSVIGSKVIGIQFSIPNAHKYWKCESREFKFDDFIKYARNRYENNKDKFKDIGLKKDHIYKLIIKDNGKKYEFVVVIF